ANLMQAEHSQTPTSLCCSRTRRRTPHPFPTRRSSDLSRESMLYNKSETLYGLDVAREEIRKKKSAVLCEGYFDCIGLHQAGVKKDRKSTRLNSSHVKISYAVFCLKKKKRASTALSRTP